MSTHFTFCRLPDTSAVAARAGNGNGNGSAGGVGSELFEKFQRQKLSKENGHAISNSLNDR